MKKQTKERRRKHVQKSIPGCVSLHDPGIDRIFVYRDCIRRDVPGKGISFPVGGLNEHSGVRGERAVSGGKFFCAGGQFYRYYVYDVYGKCASYFLWPFPVRTFWKDGEEKAVYDFFTDG